MTRNSRSRRPIEVVYTEPTVVVPGELVLQSTPIGSSNNNLDACDYDGRRFVAWRTAPSHFASADVRIHVVSKAPDDAIWQHETTVYLGRDVREPRLFPWRGDLFMYFFSLGDNWRKFEPDRIHVTKRSSEGEWATPSPCSEKGSVVWRVREVAGVPIMTTYRGAETIYGRQPSPTTVEILTTDDGLAWRPLDALSPVSHVGGTETEVIEAPSGGLVAVTRKEGPVGFGSDICTFKDFGDEWKCHSFQNKLDSPLLFAQDDQILLIARRSLEFDGRYDLGLDSLDPASRMRIYHRAYWATPKRTSLWRIDAPSLDIDFVCDLPGQGDTCFPALIAEAPGEYSLYNYTSPLEGHDLPWIAGQFGETQIYSTRLTITLR